MRLCFFHTALRTVGALVLCCALTHCTTSSNTTSSCVSGTSYLNYVPVTNAADYQGVIPMGSLDPGNGVVFPSARVFFNPAPDDLGVTPKLYTEFNVVSPGKVRVIGITYRHYDAGFDEYTLFMKPCPSQRVILQSVSALDTTFRDNLDNLNPDWDTTGVCIDGSDEWGGDYSDCTRFLQGVVLDAQEPIGSAGKYKPLGFGIYADDAEVSYTTPLYYTQSLTGLEDLLGFTLENRLQLEIFAPGYPAPIHSACPFKYYPSSGSHFPVVDFQDFDGNSFGAWDGTNCGGFVEESATSGASANWFNKTALDDVILDDGVLSFITEPLSIALVHERIRQDGGGNLGYPVFSMGSAVPTIGGANTVLDTGTYAFTVAGAGTTNRDFDDLVVNTEYCYENLTRLEGATTFDGVIRLLLTDSNTLKVEAFDAPGATCANTTFDATALLYVR